MTGTVQHPSGTVSTFSLQPISEDPDTQVAQTISAMRRYASEDSSSAQIIGEARAAVVESAGGDPIYAVWQYVRNRMRFVQDADAAAGLQKSLPDQVVEVLIRPRDMHSWQQGDCDDFVTYGACLLIALGVPVAFVTVGADRQVPDQYTHVYLAAYPVGGTRTALDLSHGEYLGWEKQEVTRFREWPVTGGRMVDVLCEFLPLMGLAYAGWLLVGSRRSAG